jgi:hypothetical protein
MFDKLIKKCITREDDEPSWGFIYSSPTEEITKKDIEYVGPEGEKYKYEEEQGVLGKSATNNPRVVFLDPAEHGGSYKKPKYFIEPQKHQGWRKLAKVFVPNSDKKGDPVTFLHVPTIVEAMEKTMNSLDADPRLEISPDELPEVPFDKIAAPTKFGSIEGIITATIRVYLADFFIRAMPIISNIELNNKNYDDSMVQFISEVMYSGFISQTSSRASVYSGYVYWLLFLEQVVQSFDRKYEAYMEKIKKVKEKGPLPQKLIDLEAELLKYNLNLIKIRAAQDNFVFDTGLVLPFLYKEKTWKLSDPRKSNSLGIDREALEEAVETYENAIANSELGQSKKFKKALEEKREDLNLIKEKQEIHESKKMFGDNVVRGALLIAYGKDYWRWLSLTKAEWAEKIIPSPLSKVEEQTGFISNKRINVNFKKLDLKDANFASKIHSIHSVEEDCKQILKFLIKEQIDYYAPVFSESVEPYVKDVNRYFFGASNIFKNTPTLGVESESFENIRGCVSDPSKQNPMDNFSFTTEELNKMKANGSFFFEKYIRVVEKEGSPLNSQDALLKGVVNPKKFMAFLKSKRKLIDETKPISEYFGNARIVTDTIVGSIGIRFGIRLCFAPPEGFVDVESSTTNLKMARKNKSFIFKEALVDSKPEAIANAFKIAKENSDEAMTLLTAAIPALGAALAVAGVGGDEFEKVMEIVEGFIPKTEFKSSKNIFPVCSFEQDLPDESMSYYLNLPDDNFNQDITCYVDGLFQSKEFKLLFEKAANIKRIPSLMSIYSYTNFLSAIGLEGDEREDSDETDINANNMGRVFNDSKKELKKMFITAYKRDDVDQEDEDIREDAVVKDKNKKLNSTLDHVVMSKEIPWFSKWNRALENPFIGWAFGNKYVKMFDLIRPKD